MFSLRKNTSGLSLRHLDGLAARRALAGGRTLAGAAGFVAALLLPSAARAQSKTMGDVAKQVFDQLDNVGTLIVGGAFIIGIGLIIAGLLKLKAAAETQGQQVKWGDGIWRIVVGVGLVSLLYFTGVGAATFGFDTDASLTGSVGS